MDKKDITKQIEELELLHLLTSAYAEISSGRMKKTREGVLTSRQFIEELSAIFREIRASYRAQVQALAKKKGFKKGEKITFLSHNGKKVAVFLSANTGFYGSLTRQIFDLFMDDVKKENLEATVVGKLGLALFRERAPNMPYSYFDLPDSKSDTEKLGLLVRHLVQYDSIQIYYGKFKSIINQIPDKVSISAVTEISGEEAVEKTKYIFEPTLEDILMFFETEMFSYTFEQTISESQLAKFASRMIAMDQAGEKIRGSLDVLKLDNLRVTHGIQNRKQLEYLSSILNSGRI